LYGIESGATPLRSETIHNGQAPGIQFATLGDDPLLLVGWSPIEIWIGRRNGQQTEQLVSGDESEFHGGAFSDPGLAPTVVNRDLDGDGRPELLAVFYTRTNTTTPICAIWVARADSDGVKLTRAGSGDFMCANGAAALVDAPPLDGRLDMLFFDGASHLLLARQLADGTFQFPKLPDGGGAAEPAPALFDDGTGVRQWDPSWTWIDTVDMNGDGIPDVVFSAPEGVYVALAEVKLR